MNFFQRFFSFLSGGKKKTETKPTPPTEVPTTEEELPEIVDVEPQDGADVPDDNDEVVLVNAEVVEPSIDTEKETEPIDNSKEEVTPPIKEEPEEPTPSKHTPRYLWILDNGHGKKTKGKRSPKWNDGEQVLEYELNRGIVNKIIESLEAKGVKYHNLVPEINVGNILKTRVARANSLKVKSSLPCLYVSIHSNAGPEDQAGKWSSAEGIETWYFRSSKGGRKAAKIFQKHLINKTGWVNRDVRTGMNFYVLKNTSMPAVLTENGFFNNKKEGRKLLTDETRQLIADAHVDAIMEIEIHGIDGLKG